MNSRPQTSLATTAVIGMQSQELPRAAWQQQAADARARVCSILTAAHRLDEGFLEVEHTIRLTGIALRLLQGPELIGGDRDAVASRAFDLTTLVLAALNTPGETISPARRALLEAAHVVLDGLTDQLIGADSSHHIAAQVH